MSKKSLIIISIIFLISFGLVSNVFAVTAGEVKEQINDINSQIEALDKEIAKYQNQITETSQQKDSLNKTIQELTLTRSKLLAERNQIQKKINATSLIIKEIGTTIETKEQSIEKSRASLKKMLYSLYQRESESFVERILSKETLEDISREYNNTVAINEDVRNYINELHYIKGELSDTKTQKLEEQEKLNELKKTLVEKETVVLNTKKEKDTLLAQTKNKEAEYQKMLAEQLKRRDAFEKELEEYEAQLKFILDPNSIPSEGSEPLAWPLDYILVTSLYGERWGRFHYGLDFRATVGTQVKAMAPGVVLGTGNTDTACQGASFGRWIFIKYDNGLSSTYGHLSGINIKTGDRVKTGDIVGLSGGTKGVFGSGSSTGPHLHVSVYASDGVNVDNVPSNACKGKIFTQPVAAKTAHLNPALYLPKITASMVKK